MLSFERIRWHYLKAESWGAHSNYNPKKSLIFRPGDIFWVVLVNGGLQRPMTHAGRGGEPNEAMGTQGMTETETDNGGGRDEARSISNQPHDYPPLTLVDV